MSLDTADVSCQSPCGLALLSGQQRTARIGSGLGLRPALLLGAAVPRPEILPLSAGEQ